MTIMQNKLVRQIVHHLTDLVALAAASQIFHVLGVVFLALLGFLTYPPNSMTTLIAATLLCLLSYYLSYLITKRRTADFYISKYEYPKIIEEKFEECNNLLWKTTLKENGVKNISNYPYCPHCHYELVYGDSFHTLHCPNLLECTYDLDDSLATLGRNTAISMLIKNVHNKSL